MKIKLLLLIIVFTSFSCSSVKKTQEAINYGDYDNAISISLKYLRDNKFKKSNQPYIYLLEEAYAKANDRDINRIKYLEQEGKDSGLEEIYNTYVDINNRQEAIKPLLPLTIAESNRNAKFKFSDYTNNLIYSKDEFSEYLYVNAEDQLDIASSKLDFRNVYSNLEYLNKINPNYEETADLLEEAHFNGTNFVSVSMLNNSDKVIPKRLEADLLNFNTYNLNDFWTVYHSKKQSDINYDYNLNIFLQEILISPEFVKEKELVRDLEIIDGWKYVKNENGEILKDSTGNSIKEDVYKRVRCKLNRVSQTKSTKVIGEVVYLNTATKQLLKSYPLASEFIFENDYATFKGDRRALTKDDLILTKNRFVPFPSNEQMVFDSGEDLKEKIRQIIVRYKI